MDKDSNIYKGKVKYGHEKNLGEKLRGYQQASIG